MTQPKHITIRVHGASISIALESSEFWGAKDVWEELIHPMLLALGYDKNMVALAAAECVH